ncbi:hypothetical protein RJ639_046766 [Escallonia herrerae]|uniref:Cation/H+ exchanger domain-containing protein n=1 Tax=Escallonia herrerae TaxID=1293975 RepID=A0AA89B1V4_9ASTE|nr:hypothetical protein RJ639_046766 [Escallonia herrerae]
MSMFNSPDKSTICVPHKSSSSKGIFLGDNPFRFPTPLLLAQLSLCSFFAAVLQFVLLPLGETVFAAQILAGILLGPAVMGKIHQFQDQVYPPESSYIGETFSIFGVMLFLFIVGVKTDLNFLRKPGRKAVAIGICTFIVPLALNLLLALIVRHSVAMDPNLHKSLLWVASFQSLSSFHVIVCLLADLNLLNSELGRLAISSSIISGTCSWFLTMIIFTAKQSMEGSKQDTLLLLFFFVACLLITVIYVLRPLMFWMIRQTTNHKAIRESYVIAVFLMILGCAMFGEIMGQHFLFGPIILGMAVPDGPPLGSALLTKLDCIVSSVLVPVYFIISGARIDFSLMHPRNVAIIELLAFLGFVWKAVGAMLPSLYCRMPLSDSLYLGLIMSGQGIMDVLVFERARQLDLISPESYSIMVLSAVLFTGIITPIVKFSYKPSRRYAAYKKRTIQHSAPHAELRMLACIHYQDQTPAILNLLEASNPTSKSPICLYVIHLVELIGRAAPLFVAHHPGGRSTSHSNQSDHIVNAFRLYEQQRHGNLMVYPFTAISPYASMHDDVCSLALDKRVSIVILPFHTFQTIQGTEGSANSIGAVNRNILKMAPCSVGVLVDRDTKNGEAPLSASPDLYSIGVIFLGGQDDREALAYASRMAKHPNVSLRVVHFIVPCNNQSYSSEQEHDIVMIKEFMNANGKNELCVYQEEVVKDSVGVVSVIHKVENCFDLILVGRHHAKDSPLLVGLKEWNEFPELGFIGDMLASSDSNCKVSVLVVQQQACADGNLLDSPEYILEQHSSAIVDMPLSLVK